MQHQVSMWPSLSHEGKSPRLSSGRRGLCRRQESQEQRAEKLAHHFTQLTAGFVLSYRSQGR